MIGFLGTYQVSLDEKGRINIPARFKAILDRQYDSHDLVAVIMDNLPGPAITCTSCRPIPLGSTR